MDNAQVFGVILAGGIGTRMGNVEKPKQYLKIGGKPIIIHTIEKFAINSSFAKIVVLCPKQWIKHTQDMVKNYIPMQENVVVILGGNTRNETIMNAIEWISANYGVGDETVIVTHDAVRPFVTHRIIQDNINYVRKYDACDTVIPASDTIIQSLNGEYIHDVPSRDSMFQGQTPQSFKAKKLLELYHSLSEKEKQLLTDACKIFVLKGEKVYLVMGEVFNFKITFPYDIRVAESLLGGDKIC